VEAHGQLPSLPPLPLNPALVRLLIPVSHIHCSLLTRHYYEETKPWELSSSDQSRTGGVLGAVTHQQQFRGAILNVSYIHLLW